MQGPKYVFQKTYAAADSAIVIVDIYQQCSKYHLQQIPLNQWITNVISVDSVTYVQKMIHHDVAKNESYYFIYTKFTDPKKTYYEFKVRYLGKEK